MKFIIFFISIIISRIESIQFDELNFNNNQDLITKQEHDSFERLKIEKVNAFFNAFKSETSKSESLELEFCSIIFESCFSILFI